ncbi:hypothetical protein [Bacillus sp. JCM 19034]|uniref:hypothetical protein n=1 Tax=Bacillus sp. JCM 19034 TaxID=1481928 RepID=UPI00351DA40E
MNSTSLSVKIANSIQSQFVDGYHPKIANKWGYVAGMTLKALDWLSEWKRMSTIMRSLGVTLIYL